MKKRWPVFVGYAIAVTLQVALLGGAYRLHALSRQKMMVMRYLVARNLELEAFWFSPNALLVQTTAFLAMALGLAVFAAVLLRRPRRAAFAHALIGVALAGLGAYLTAAVSADEVRALYAIVAAVWVALFVQCGVIAMALATSARAHRAAPVGTQRR